MTRLGRAFFSREALVVAPALLGQVLVHDLDGSRIAGRVVEVEVYSGWEDHASHGFRGVTPRNAVMFGQAGISYVYLCYGVHWLLNVVARPPQVDYPAAILLRALEPSAGFDLMESNRPGRPQREWTNGPGRLTLALGINKQHNGLDMVAPDSRLYFESGDSIPEAGIGRGPRIGIHVPEPSCSQPWRFWIHDNPFVSRSGS